MLTQTTETGGPSLADAEVAKKTIPILKRLIGICKDGEYGFRVAASDVRAPACKTLFLTYANQRRALAVELENAIRRLGGAPDSGGTLAGRMHREWMDLLARVFERRDAETIVTECERGEERALRAYEQALRTVFDPGARALVARQRDAIRDVRDRLRSLGIGT